MVFTVCRLPLVACLESNFTHVLLVVDETCHHISQFIGCQYELLHSIWSALDHGFTPRLWRDCQTQRTELRATRPYKVSKICLGRMAKLAVAMVVVVLFTLAALVVDTGSMFLATMTFAS